MMRLVAAYRLEALLVVALIGSYAAAILVSSRVSAEGAALAVIAALALSAAPAVPMGALYFRLRRLGYGLEFMLLSAIPFGATLASISYIVAVSYLVDLGLDALNLILIWRLISPLTTAILLAAFYLYVRRARGSIIEIAGGLLLAVTVVRLAIVAYQIAPDLRIPTLYVTAALLVAAYAYIWRLRLNHARLICWAVSAAAAVHFVFALPDFPIEISYRARQFIYSTSARFFISELATMLLALWFARQASKISLAHAFFIAALVFTFPLSRLLSGDSIGQAADTSQRIESLTLTAQVALQVSATLAAVWLLGSFDRRGPAFNKRAAMALFGIQAATGVAAAILLIARGDAAIALDAPTLIIFAGWGVTLVLVYLLRVRQPAPQQESA